MITIEKILLKDKLLNEEKILYLASLIKNVYPEFNSKDFIDYIFFNLKNLELKERVYIIRDALYKFLPKNYSSAITILESSLPQFYTETGDFIFAPFSEYVAFYGCNKTYLNLSLSSLEKFTAFFSAEFAIREFINTFPEETFNHIKKLTNSKNVHHRRLASEGFRPRLPWGKSINFDYKKSAILLNYLYNDSDKYVIRSVANHLNDISKFDSKFVFDILKKWKNENKDISTNFQYLINHSLRTLIKKGDKECFEFLGYNSNPKIEIKNFIIKNKNITLGDYLFFSFEILFASKEEYIIDYKITYPNPKNKISEKVFKLNKIKISNNNCLTINKSHLFKQMTTKKLYNGKYSITIQVNGVCIFTDYFFINF